MKFSLFVHMERIDAAESQKQLYDEFLELCEIADKGGMYAIWTGEHHGMNFTIAPNPFLSLVDLARRTENVRLGTGTIVAPFWHPIKLAGEAAMADILMDGRLDVGVARAPTATSMNGWFRVWMRGRQGRGCAKSFQPSCGCGKATMRMRASSGAFPPPLRRRSRCRNRIRRSGWRRAIPNSHEFAVSNGFNVQVTPLWNDDGEVDSLMQRFNDACGKYPDVERPKIMLLRHTYVGDGEADIRQAAEEINRFYNYFGAWFKNERPVSQGLIETLSEEDIASHPFYTPAEMRRANVIGDADEVIERLRYYEGLGYDEYSFWIDSGMSFERKRASLVRFIEQVMPAFDG